jgi:hypothetical protein
MPGEGMDAHYLKDNSMEWLIEVFVAWILSRSED